MNKILQWDSELVVFTQPVDLIEGLYFDFAIGQFSEMPLEEMIGKKVCRTKVASKVSAHS